jgi:hypothetical protein
MTKKILAEISVGELLDKISILEIKKKKINDKTKLAFINTEYKILDKLRKKINLKKEINFFYKQLINTNQTLWNIENKIRKHEKLNIFDKKFIFLARKVYLTNDKRSKIKLKINTLMKSNIVEMKSYSKYI